MIKTKTLNTSSHLESSGGVLSGKVGTGMCGPDRRLFGLSGLPMAPFLFENWFGYRSHFCKIHNFH